MVDIATGDIVHIRAKVLCEGASSPSAVHLTIGDGEAFCIHRKHIVHVEPRPLQVGDVVTWGTGIIHYSVLALAHDRAWLKPVDGDSYETKHLPDETKHLSDLKLVARAPNTTNTKQEG